MAEGTIAPFPYHIFFDADGTAPNAGGKIYTFLAGTSTAEAVYTDADLSVAHANPIVLDSAGRPPSPIYLDAKSYKFVEKTSADVTIKTTDPVPATPKFDVDLDVTGTAGEALSATELAYMSDGSNSKTVGRWYLADSDLVYGSIGAIKTGFVVSDIASGESGTIRVGGRLTGLSGLSAGSLYYPSSTAGAITASRPTNARPVGAADSATSLVIINTEPRNVQTNLDAETTAVGNVGAGEDDLQTFSLPAAMLTETGAGVRILAWGTTANNADAKTIKLYFGTDEILSLSATVSEAGMWMIGAHVVRTGAATQLAVASGTCGPADSTITATSSDTSSPTQTLANAVTIKCTGEATTNDDIEQLGMVVRLG